MKKAFTLKAVFFIAIITSHFYSNAQTTGKDTTVKPTVAAQDTGKLIVTPTDSTKKDSTIILQARPKTVFLEVGGPGLALTVNYDSRFGQRRDKWGYRAGTGYYNTGANSVFTIPLQVNYLYSFNQGEGSHFLELGAGTTFVYSKGSTNGKTFQFDNITGLIATFTIGYRYQPEEGGINIRAGFVPIIYDEGLIAAGGISVGWTF